MGNKEERWREIEIGYSLLVVLALEMGMRMKDGVDQDGDWVMRCSSRMGGKGGAASATSAYSFLKILSFGSSIIYL